MTERPTRSQNGILRGGRSAMSAMLTGLGIAVAMPAADALAQTGAGQSAVVLNYQRFGESEYPRTSVATAQFETQIKLLSGDRYNVMPAGDIVSTLFAGGQLPNRTVAITIDDAFRSAYEVAWPRLKAAGLPVTVFVSTDPVDHGLPGYMSWDQIRELRDAGATIGAHTAGHPHMVDQSPEENRADMERSLARFEAELGERPKLFSYPHGEMSLAVRDVVANAGFDAAFGQHSGAVNMASDRYFLPRFSINERYGAMGEFRMRVDTLGLPVHDLSPPDPYLTSGEPPVVGFALDDGVIRGRKLACFFAQGDDSFVEVPITELEGRRRELRFDKPFRRGAWRVNCTMPTGGKRYRWFGMQFYSAGG